MYSQDKKKTHLLIYAIVSHSPSAPSELRVFKTKAAKDVLIINVILGPADWGKHLLEKYSVMCFN